MTDFKALILAIVSPLVDHPDALAVSMTETDRFYEYRLAVHPDDVGRVIGKQGRVAQAIRTIVYSVRVQGNKRVRLIIDDQPAKTLE
ncbi:KH domain-containing protein [Levilactobacillus namurensis]|uniref:KH domain-containing protein n=1 Tax=Levilactobacillus namurensis TaxID=380393 RepID=UPI00222E96F5|nr:KH domain-containing protein [Levilactobacillus namurensis]MCW3777564.1 KH domain-containing protein [Levilactobacillus namurensis]MDT7018764.1 KH domain-containing protein [Levilactobacillus namurensis]WNN66616.1 KH domain-containing protein [Levilactobacillus namurensis]